MSNKLSLTKLSVVLFISWLIPLLYSFAFFKPDETGKVVLFVEKEIFKNFMACTSNIFGTILLAYALKQDYTFNNILFLSSSFLIVNLILDVTVLVPMINMPLLDWFIEIGLGYFNIFVFAFVGYALAKPPISQRFSLWNVLLRTPLPSLTSYVFLSLFYDRQQNLLYPEYFMINGMALAGNVLFALNFVKACERAPNLKEVIPLATLVFTLATILMDISLIPPVYKWTTKQYLFNRGMRIISAALSMLYIGRDAAIVRTKNQAEKEE